MVWPGQPSNRGRLKNRTEREHSLFGIIRDHCCAALLVLVIGNELSIRILHETLELLHTTACKSLRPKSKIFVSDQSNMNSV